jgi:hypothetical protein
MQRCRSLWKRAKNFSTPTPEPVRTRQGVDAKTLYDRGGARRCSVGNVTRSGVLHPSVLALYHCRIVPGALRVCSLRRGRSARRSVEGLRQNRH